MGYNVKIFMSKEVLKKVNINKLGPVGLVILATVLSACGSTGAQPNIEFAINNCDDTRILELGPGDKVDLIDINPVVNFQIGADGRVTPPDEANFGVLQSGTGWWFGGRNQNRPYYLVLDQGDLNNNGLTDIMIQKVCPVAPTSMNQAPIGSGKLASLPRGFASRGSKPARG